jgi:nitrogenase molybdenum-iron protein alpha/beta subunit
MTNGVESINNEYFCLERKIIGTMGSITIYPTNERQKFLLKSLLEEMKVRFDMVENDDLTLLSEDEFYAKIDKSIEQAKAGKINIISKNRQNELLGL